MTETLAPAREFPSFPGAIEERGIYVRRTPVTDPQAPRTLYVHGLGGSSLNWTDLMALRAEKSPGLALDLPGFGFSAAVPQHTLEEHAAAVVDVLEREGTGPLNLVGNSMGGAVSIMVAAQRPDLVRAVTLVSPALPGQRVRLAHATIALATVPGVSARLKDMMQKQSAEERIDNLFALVFHDPSVVSSDRRLAAIEEQRRRDTLAHSWDAFAHSSKALTRAMLSPFGVDLFGALKRVQAPVLGLFGTHDKLVDVGVAPKAAKRIRRGRVVVLPRMGHVAQMEDPRLVAALMADFEAEYLSSR